MSRWQQLKNIYHFGQAQAWRWWYGRPDRGLHLYGITGTNGKTTTSYILASILAAAYGRKHVGLLTTVAFWVGEDEIINATKMTTLPSRLIFFYLWRMRRAGVSHVVMEITSHALDQHRLAGVLLAGGIVLNISREHLDYHRTMTAYAAAKERLLNYLADGAPLVGKEDDPYVSRILTAARESSRQVIPFTAVQAHAVATPLPGEVNRENALAATLLAQACRVPAAAIAAGIAAVKNVPGRMEWLALKNGVQVLIDYAVTPGALTALYRDVRATTKGKIYAVLGAAGQRDRGKRPAMAAAVATYADEIVLTREDPWRENEEQIFSDLERGLQTTDKSWRRIVDRTAALRYCLQRAQAGDVIVATGKGAERGMGIGSKVIPWHEKTVIGQLAEELGQ